MQEKLPRWCRCNWGLQEN